MRFLVYGVLALAALVLSGALLAGFSFKVAGLGLLAVLVVAAIAFFVDRVRDDYEPRGTLRLDREVPRNTLRQDYSDYAERLRAETISPRSPRG